MTGPLPRFRSFGLALLVLGGGFLSLGPAHGAVRLQAGQAPPRTLNSGDEITIVVLRHPEFSGDFLVPLSGVIQVPGAGDIDVIGASPDAVSRQVAERLKARLLHPEVSARLKFSLGLNINVLGDVQKSGTYEIRPGWGVAESLSAAGGLAANIQRKDVRVTLEKATGETVRLSLDEALDRANHDRMAVKAGDLLRFDAVATIPVYITGHVRTPGMYKLREDNTDVLAAVSQAGGATDDASLSNVRIVRVAGGEEVVDLTPSLVRGESQRLPRLSAGDMVIVSEATTRFAVLGYVSKPGYYPVPQGRPFFLSDAIAQASGADRRGRLTKVGVVRTEGGKPVRRVYDLGKYLNGGDPSQNPPVGAGDLIYVPETGRADNNTIFTALGASLGFFGLFRR